MPSLPGQRYRAIAVGADGTRGGWAAAVLYTDGTTRLQLFGDVAELAAFREEAGATVAIDIPIGLLDTVGFRTCDRQARALLGPRPSSVFAPPARDPAARGLSAQAAGIAAKV